MHWVLALIGALVGAVVGAEIDDDAILPGALATAALVWLLVRVGQLSGRVGALEARLGAQAAPTRAESVAPPTGAVAAGAATPPATAAAAAPPAADGATTPFLQPPPQAQQPSSAPAAAQWRPAAALPTTGAAAAQPPMRPRRPRADQALGRLLRRWFLEGNVPVKLGSLVLFAGVAAALKYASDQGYFTLPVEFRLAGIALAAIGVLLWGWRNRHVRPAFGLSLQGMAIGVLLLTVFAAFRIYALLPAGLALALVVGLVAATALLAVLQDALWLALLGLVGGYLAPVLVSTGSGSHVALFTYYTVLNAAVFAIAWIRPWRALNLVGFGFTFAIGTLWGWRYYRPEHFDSTEPFLVLFFLFYVAIPVLYALRQAPVKRGLVDGTLVFGTPLLAFPLQAALLEGQSMPLAYSALAVALLYALLAAWLLRVRGIVLLGAAFAALAIGFATLAVPLALSARWTSATWALEGAALVWLGLRQRQRLPQLAGWLLQVGAALAYAFALVDHGWRAGEGELPLLNGHALGVLLMAASAFFISWCHDRASRHRLLVWPPFLAGLAWWHVAGVREIDEHLDAFDERLALIGLLALTAALAALLRGALRWPRLGWIVVYACVAAVPFALIAGDPGQGVLRLPAAPWWAALLAALLVGLARLRTPEQKGLSFAHVAVLWTVAAALGTSLHHEAAVVQQLGSGWQALALVLPLVLLMLASWRWPQWTAWPLADRFDRYRWRWLGPAMAVLAVVWMVSLRDAGDAQPLPFVPLVNPLELLQLAVLLLAARIVLHAPLLPATRQLAWVSLAAAGFAFVTMAGLRAVHQLADDAPWSPWLLDNATAQTTLTVLWSVLGVLAWVLGSRRRQFPVWLAGAILMGVVLAKLVLVDRQYMGDFTGIVSFLAVGGLLVLVGRIAPTPPRRLAATTVGVPPPAASTGVP